MKKPPQPKHREPRKPKGNRPVRQRAPEVPREGSEPGIRLQRFLASTGLGSRRRCEQLIIEGRVEVDGKVVEALGTRVRPYQQKITVDGTRLRPPRRRYYLVHKPVGVLTTHRDPAGRTRVIDLIPQGERYFTVGRLDRNSEGLILVTNDGDLANGLAHPRYGVTKTYRVEVAGLPDREAIAQLRSGIHLAEGTVRASEVRVLKPRRNSTLLEMVLREGKNREIRRMAARIGHKVLSLRRIAMGPLRLGELPVGAYRELTGDEVQSLQAAIRQRGGPAKPAGRRPGRSGPPRRPGVRATTGRPAHPPSKSRGRRPSRPMGKR